MHVKVKQIGEKERVFPWLGMTDESLIVLFTSSKTGTVLDSGDTVWEIGEFDEDWNIDDFEEFKDELVLRN